ncbi:hypothetical protein ACPOL_7122 (plasmid) [Acidisarcina polymorpha]|uniref:Uncharacterized protein n=1 Tax=Acidisarcina polymorpha TaxID=2211140 RepID=A0A2Z5GC63_9BACT|nr:hypothetical protein ACPOL_7122 [Acidisarcina polymorpha]
MAFGSIPSAHLPVYTVRSRTLDKVAKIVTSTALASSDLYLSKKE